MSIPTKGEKFAELLEHLRKAEEASAMLGHLHADEDPLMLKGWLAISELLKLTIHNVTKLAARGLIKWN
ncbi:MAG TPA: hypothetical protein VN203_16645 [Candidatus Acidoferrum sp.]|nr:hypothetical protein [Candidatus Acidoferrum sp.]